jgi:sulfide:quinone oxidoreductase
VSHRSNSSTSVTRVAIAGGGFAAIEAALALRALAKQRIKLTLISPNAEFVYRPAATVEAFEDEPAFRYDLGEIAADLGADHHRAALEAVAPQEQRVRLNSGKRLDYDFLVLALGARARAAIPGAFTFRDQRDLPRFRILLDELAAGRTGRAAFAVPSGNAWSLPAYELAFLCANYAASYGANVEIVIVTPEPTPLAVFGGRASGLVAKLLAERGIGFVGRAIPHSVLRDGSLSLQFDAPVDADRVVAIPDLHGPRVIGVPATWSGFVSTDRSGLVEGLPSVYAAGDMTTFPIKQGGIAAQQADVVAHTIAAGLGAPVKELRQTRILRARLLDGEGAVVLRTELDALGRPTAATLQHHESRRTAELKVFGLYLTPYLSLYRSRHPAAV